MSERTIYRLLTGDDSGEFPTPTYDALADVVREMQRAHRIHPTHPNDPVRFTALLVEEAGEALTAALDLTRIPNPAVTDARTKDLTQLELLLDLHAETCHAAAMAVHNIIKLREMIAEMRRQNDDGH